MATIDGIEPGIGVQAGGALSGSGSETQSPEQLRTLAAQFESLLLTQMMNAMRSSMFDEESEDAGFAKGPLADALYSELSMALSRAGGFGFADSMMGPLMQQTGAGTKGPQGLANPLEIAMPALTGIRMPKAGISLSSSDAGTGTNSLDAVLSPSGLANPALSALGAASTGGRLPAFLSARVSSQYGWRQDPISGEKKFHPGTDIAVPIGHDVPSASAGRVTFAGERTGYGMTVEVAHPGGMKTRYAHLSEITAQAGDVVEAGQSVGKSGATGRVTGPHLHFEVLEQGQAIDLSTGLMKLGLSGASED